jgi:hypothetical protein
MQLSMHDYVRFMVFLLLQFCLFMIEAIKLGQYYQHQASCLHVLAISSLFSWFVLFTKLSLLKIVFCSLENAGESSVLPILRSLRMLFELVARVTPSAVVSCSNVIDAQVYFIACYLVCISYIQ